MALFSRSSGAGSDAQKAAREIAKRHSKAGRQAGQQAGKRATKNISRDVGDLLRRINKDTSTTLDQVFKGVDRAVRGIAGGH